VRHSARAQGRRAKADRLDVAALTAYGQALQPKPAPARSQLQQQLTELVRRRADTPETAGSNAASVSSSK